jgi:hypothetical protein
MVRFYLAKVEVADSDDAGIRKCAIGQSANGPLCSECQAAENIFLEQDSGSLDQFRVKSGNGGAATQPLRATSVQQLNEDRRTTTVLVALLS